MMLKNGRGLLGYGTLKSVWYQEWLNDLSWFFASLYIFRKTKSYSKSYWENVVKYGFALLGHGALHLLLLPEKCHKEKAHF